MPKTTPTAQKPTPESSTPAVIEAVAAQRATIRSLLAVSTPRSRGEVMSARIDVPATKQPAQPRPSRKKNGVISGEAPVRAVPKEPTAQAPRPSRLVRRRPMRSASRPTG